MTSDSKQQEDIMFDPQNARLHPDRNKQLIRESLEQVGAFRSIAIDGDNIVRAGNGVWEAAQELGLKLRVIDAGADEIIGVRRPDLTGDKATLAAVYDNRTGETSVWNLETLEEIDMSLGLVDSTSLWTPDEWTELLDPDSLSEEPPEISYAFPVTQDGERGPPKQSGRGTVGLSDRPDHDEKYPVPIVLTRQEYETWIKVKAEISQQQGKPLRDKDAFWSLVDHAWGKIGPDAQEG
jgi:hypothetical protein